MPKKIEDLAPADYGMESDDPELEHDCPDCQCEIPPKREKVECVKATLTLQRSKKKNK